MQRSLFPGKWIPVRISPWDLDKPEFQFHPEKDRTYQDAVLNRNKEANPQLTRVMAGQRDKEDKKYFYDPLDGKNQINKFGNNRLPNYYNDSSWQRPVEKPKDDRLRDDLWNFKSLVEKVLDSEGGFSNRKNDRGGATNRGITLETWKATAKKYFGVEPTLENLKKLTKEEAEKIYLNEYWNKSRAEEVKHGPMRYLLFDFYVNSGPKTAARNLQRAINQEGGRLQEDGIMRTETLDALNAHPDPEAVYWRYKQNRIERYKQEAKDDPRQKDFIKGWLNRMKNF